MRRRMDRLFTSDSLHFIPVRRCPSPLAVAFHNLRAVNPAWDVQIRIPDEKNGWIRGTDFACATTGPFRSLLERIGEQLHTSDRRTIAASFAIRYVGWSSSVASHPLLTLHIVAFRASLSPMFRSSSAKAACLREPRSTVRRRCHVERRQRNRFIPDNTTWF